MSDHQPPRRSPPEPPPGAYRTYPADYFPEPDGGGSGPVPRGSGGPGPAGARSPLLTARVLIALTVVVGQLWALPVAANAWLSGDTDTAWWTTAFSGACFLVVALIWRLAPERER
ncbi:DUF6755 family protein [Kitasatospora sp. NBC_01266]|uniref:DUF6755 family protein n=1 Tax=Kitasatospora sp. NBC_01266 TaxID=2903572 RepID=UPI002E34EC29|nr:DUF6755 family protein [Kitasatospora sp. NBC_01266]